MGQFDDSRLDYQTGKVVWNHETGEGEGIAGILTTAGHLLFTGDNGDNLLALDPATGNTPVASKSRRRVGRFPDDLSAGGKAVRLMPVQDVLYAFALQRTLQGEQLTALTYYATSSSGSTVSLPLVSWPLNRNG